MDPRLEKLSVRTRHCLFRADLLTLDALRHKRPDDLLKLPNFGKKCLQEVIDLLGQYGPSLGGEREPSSEINSVLNAAPAPPGTLEETVEALASLASTRALETWAKAPVTVRIGLLTEISKAVENQVRAGILDDRALMQWRECQHLTAAFSPRPRVLSDLLRRLQHCPEFADDETLKQLERALEVPHANTEVQTVLGQLPERDRLIIQGRFNLRKSQTLEDLGSQAGVTRERVRQIEAKVVKKLRNALEARPVPRFWTAVLLLTEHNVTSVAEVQALLLGRDLVSCLEGVDDFLLTWRAASPQALPFPEAIVSTAKTGLTPRLQAASRGILNITNRMIRQTGVVSVEQVLQLVKDAGLSQADIIMVLRAKGLQELLPGQWHKSIRKSVPWSVARKMLAICGPLHVRQIRRGLVRHQRRQGYPVPPAGILQAFLAQYPQDFEVKGDGTIALRKQMMDIELARAESAWRGAVTRFGPVVHADTIYRVLMGVGLAAITAAALMWRSELVQPLGHGLYSLPGALIRETDLAAGRMQMVRINCDHDLRYGADGSVVFETTVQQYLGYSGSLIAGPASALAGRWQAVVDAERIGEFTVGSPWIFGLQEIQRRLDIQQGDRIQIRFDTWAKEAHVSVRWKA